MPFTVAHLIDQIAQLPAEAAVRAVVVTRSGWFHDRDHAAVDTLDVDLNPDGQVTGVWLIASEPDTARPPALMRVRCGCGEVVRVDEAAPWPADHVDCSYPSPAT